MARRSSKEATKVPNSTSFMDGQRSPWRSQGGGKKSRVSCQPDMSYRSSILSLCHFRNFVKMPSDQYMIISKLLFSHASEDVPNIAELKTLIKDIFDFRQAKLRTAIDAHFGDKKQLDGTKQLSFKHLTQFEIHTCRPFLPHATDLISRLERVCQQQASSMNESSHSSSNF